MEYEIGVFSAQTGRIELLEHGGDLSLNVVAMPRERDILVSSPRYPFE